MIEVSRRHVLAAGAATLLAAPFVRAARAAPAQVNIAYFVSTSPLMMAKAEGWLDQAAGTKVNWVEVGSGAEINTGMAAGSLDLGLGIGSSPTAAGIAQGIGVKLIGLLDNIGAAEEMTVRTAANIRTPADFKGKKVATPFGSTSHFRLLGFLKTNGLTESEVTVLDMRPDAMVAAWTRGDIDAGYVWNPAKSKMLADGGVPFPTAAKLEAAGYVIGDMITGRTAFIEANAAIMTGVLAANARAMAAWKSDPDGTAAIVGKAAGVSAATAKADMEEYDFIPVATQLSPDWLGPPGHPGKFAEVLKRTADFLVQQKSIRSAPALPVFERAIDTSYLAKAAA